MIFLVLMEFETIIMKWKQRKEAKYLTTEANWIIRCSHARRNVGFVFKTTINAFPMYNGMKESSLTANSKPPLQTLTTQPFGKWSSFPDKGSWEATPELLVRKLRGRT